VLGNTCPLNLLLRNATCDVSVGPGSELGEYSNKYSLSVTKRSLWSKQKVTWRRSLVRPSVCHVVQETKQFVDCLQSRQWRILQNRLSFEFRANRFNDSSTLPLSVQETTGTDAFEQLWLLQNGCSGSKRNLCPYFLHFQFILQKEGTGHVHGFY
jgi:hypothetical protein